MVYFQVPLRIQDLSMKPTLLGLVEGREVTQEEVGQRILTALKKKIGPSWLLYNLGALYWRVIGNNYHGLECIRRALYFAPDKFKDVALVNLAQILYKLGRVEDTVSVMRDAVLVNDLEPETHFFLGNMLAAKPQVNLTGAIYHFREALAQNPTHKEAFTALRTIMCYQKFHRPQQSAAPKESPKAENSCKADAKGNEKKNLQMCKIGNGKTMEQCKNKKQCVHLADEDCSKDKTIQEQCIHTITTEPLSDTLGSAIIDTARLEEISEYYRQNGVCKGEECQRFLVQTAHHHKPHIRLEVVDSVLQQKFIFVEPNTELELGPSECVIFNNGHKSQGCSQEVYKPYDLDKFSKFISEPLSFEPLEEKNFILAGATGKKNSDGSSLFDALGFHQFHVHEVDNSLADITRIRDATRHIHVSYELEWPSWDTCKETYKKIDWQQFLSTWVSVSTKGINVQEHIDFDYVLKDTPMETPECDVSVDPASILDDLEGVQEVLDLAYKSETGLAEHLQTLGGEFESVDVVGARIARGLKNEPTSWVLANLAALYWRVEGEAPRAVNCIKVAYHYSPKENRDIALLSLANILHQSGRLDDALTVTTMALETSPDLVAIHFTMANLFAAKGEWLRSTQFYGATLGLQNSFMPARERLRNIQCDKVLSNPHIYKNKPKKDQQ